MSIFPLPIFEADADPARREVASDAEIYARLAPPTSIVVRVGAMRHVAELRYSGDAKPGCGSKLVARTWRGTEIVEMLTTTCANSGCSKSVSRRELLDYIEASGGRDYPFHAEGQILRVATVEDLGRWSEVQAEMRDRVKDVKRIVAESGLSMKVVDVEPILGQELLTIYFLSEARVDFRELVRALAAEFQTRIEMRQVGARDEARLVADYERCGQHCCCKNFLKVLKPISMRSAKTQKATLDPLKISGRCGRLMCCLRYEDQTYEELKKRLPRTKTRVGTPEGPGMVVDAKILVQLVLVRLEADAREIAVPVEDLCDPESCPQPGRAPEGDPLRGASPETIERRVDDRQRSTRSQRTRHEQQDAFRRDSEDAESTEETDSPGASGNAEDAGEGEPASAAADATGVDPDRRRRRRRRRRRERDGRSDEGSPSAALGQPSSGTGGDAPPSHEHHQDQARSSDDAPATGELGASRRRRRRRRRHRGDGSGDGASPPPSA